MSPGPAARKPSPVNRSRGEGGYQTGYGHADARTVDEEAAASWANTTEGRMAQALGEVGNIERLYLCDQPGWKIEGEFCIPWAEKKKAPLGWRLPPPPSR